ncbi:MAG: hypothetical protein ABW122_14825 [Ilumatobacteraceae bacterium]
MDAADAAAEATTLLGHVEAAYAERAVELATATSVLPTVNAALAAPRRRPPALDPDLVLADLHDVATLLAAVASSAA